MITIHDSTFMIEHYMMVLYMSDVKIIFKMKKYFIELYGNDLLIDYYSSYEVRGHGHIKEVKFVSL